MDFAAEGLLDGLDGEERAAREQLLTRLAEEGFTAEELRTAVAENRLALLPVDRFLGGTYSAQEIEQKTGLPARLMTRVRRLTGLPEVGPDERVFSDEDIEAARSTKLFLDAGFEEERIIEITRVLGEGMSRLTATIIAAFVETFLQKGDTEEDVAERFAALADQLTPAAAPILVASFKAHLRDGVRRGIISRAELESGELGQAQELAVCFADLVGFTRLGGQVEVRELGTVAGRLAQVATLVAESPVRLIKTIGDAAMFVSPEVGPLVKVALELLKTFEEEELPSLRAGIAVGPAVLRAGDYYGHSVNLASRVTGIARPGSVLCTEEVRNAAGEDGLVWSSAGRHRLKGVAGSVTLYRARLAETVHADGAADSRSGDTDHAEKAVRRRRGDRSRRPAPD